MPGTQIHIDDIAEKGWTIIPDAIADDLVGELADDLDRLEPELAVVPADNSLEGRRTKEHSGIEGVEAGAHSRRRVRVAEHLLDVEPVEVV
jgi:hypothetical protein